MQIKINNLSYVYMKKTPNEVKALNDVSLEIPEGTKSVRVQAGVRTGKGFFSNESFIDVVDVQMR